MSETVVHVTTLEQWKSVLDVWFKQGYIWLSDDRDYSEDTFEIGGRFLNLDDYITCSITNHHSAQFLEYSEFMAQQKEDKKVKTYYVTKEQLESIEFIRNLPNPYAAILNRQYESNNIYNEVTQVSDQEWLRYFGGDETIEFKVKEPLYRLWLNDSVNDKVYFRINTYNTPASTEDKDSAFTAPIEEIEKWQTPAWEIEKVE